MRLSSQIVDFVWLRLLDDTNQICRIRNVAVVQIKSNLLFVRILIEVVDTRRVERRRASFYSVHNVSFGQQQFGQIGPVLACGTRNKRRFSK